MTSKKFQVVGAFFIFEGFLGIVAGGLACSLFGLVFGMCKFAFGIYLACCEDE